ncbi:MAG: zinc-ribbon domain-containing protein [Anaerovoracaceae bacterium]|nr:zinc-ribbon domain-containing protein [Bacillota bacterium]MDY2671360.1 zinc-ribbon domain-containing protein [Anaerovoracaceae bacterium]
MLLCKRCGAKITEETVYCPVCGAPTDKVVPLSKKAQLLSREMNYSDETDTEERKGA